MTDNTGSAGGSAAPPTEGVDEPTDERTPGHIPHDMRPDDDERNQRTRLADGEGLEVATAEDLLVQRDGDGKYLAVPQKIPGTDKRVDVIPPTPGEMNEYLPVFEGQDEDENDALQAEILATHVEQLPDDMGPGFLDRDADGPYIPGGQLSGLLRAVRNAGGYEVLAGNAQQDLEERLAMMDEVADEGVMEAVVGALNGAAEAGSGSEPQPSSE